MRELQTLKKAPRGQVLDKWLLQWETTFTEAEKLNLADIQDYKALFDFIQATKEVDAAYANGYQIHVNSRIQEGGIVPTFYDAVEAFRNNLRLQRATPKTASYSSFATFQGEPPHKSPAEPSTLKQKECLCGELHLFAMCPYIILQRQQSGWVPNKQIQKTVNDKIARNPKLKQIIKSKRRQADEKVKQTNTNTASELPGDPQQQRPASLTMITSFATFFAVDQASYQLRDTWIVDSGADFHVCNDRS